MTERDTIPLAARKRVYCPQRNIGHTFGCIGIEAKLEGSMLYPDYCIVSYADGTCEKHTEKTGWAD